MLKEKKQKIKKVSKVKSVNKEKLTKVIKKTESDVEEIIQTPTTVELKPESRVAEESVRNFEEKPTLVNFTDLISNKTYKLVVPVTVFVLVVLVTGFVIINSKNKTKNEPVVAGAVTLSPAEQARQNALNLLSQVNKVILLPTNEEPTIETVADLNLLKGQVFFNSAKVGDKVLVYLKSGKAYLFRPEENKIIEVGTFEPVVPNTKVKKTSTTKK